jgi:hypothetical protein
MPSLAEHSDISDPQDICVLLRVHSEEHWLMSEVLPVLRELEPPCAVPDEQLGAALAYLEVLWIDACSRAAETDTACAMLGPEHLHNDHLLYEKTRRYHAAVRRLRNALGRRVAERTWPADEALGSLQAHG